MRIALPVQDQLPPGLWSRTYHKRSRQVCAGARVGDLRRNDRRVSRNEPVIANLFPGFAVGDIYDRKSAGAASGGGDHPVGVEREFAGQNGDRRADRTQDGIAELID